MCFAPLFYPHYLYGMIKRLAAIIYSFLLAHIAAAQIPNADMENWTSAPELADWVTNSHPLTLPPFDPYIIRQDTDRYSGNWAADFHANGIIKAYATTTFAINQHPRQLALYYKLIYAPCVNDSGYFQQDTASVLVEILKNGSVVDRGYWQSKQQQYTYTQLLIPVTQNAVLYDSCRITIWGGNIVGGCGFAAQATEFKVDQLELKYSAQTGCIDSSALCDSCMCPLFVDPVCGCNGVTYSNYCYAAKAGVTSWAAGQCQTTGVETGTETTDAVSIYPNPAKNKLIITYANQDRQKAQVAILNLLGETVISLPAEQYSSITNIATVDINTLAAGVYVVRLQLAGKVYTRRFLKQ
jgi:hypothetical protein